MKILVIGQMTDQLMPRSMPSTENLNKVKVAVIMTGCRVGTKQIPEKSLLNPPVCVARL